MQFLVKVTIQEGGGELVFYPAQATNNNNEDLYRAFSKPFAPGLLHKSYID